MTILTLPCCGCTYNGQMPDVDAGAVNIGFWAWRNLNQAITSGVETVVNWTNKRDENPTGIMNLTTDTFTAPQAGRYIITAGVEMTIAARGSCYIRVYKNNVYQGSDSDEGSIATTVTPSVSQKDWLNANDTIQIRVFQNTGFAATLIGCCNNLWFSVGAMYAE